MLKIIKYIFNLNKKPLMLVPRLVDNHQTNAQNINARTLLPELSKKFSIVSLYEKDFDRKKFKNIKFLKLYPLRLYPYFILIFSILPCDILFYTGGEWFDYIALKIRKKFKIPGKIVSTIEGILYLNPKVKINIESLLGHPIYTESLKSSNFKIKSLHLSDHIIAITPLLQLIAKKQFKKNISYLNLGYDKNIFFKDTEIKKKQKITIVSAGTIYPRKRADFFLKIAKEIPDANFIWFGEDRGHLKKLQEEISNLKLKNIFFRPAVSQTKLAQYFNESHLFLLTSFSEGAPKVVLEAMACGLPAVIFGFYKSPFSFNKKNSYLVWNDDEFIDKVKLLVEDITIIKNMSKNCIKISTEFEWSNIAKNWSMHLEQYLTKK